MTLALGMPEPVASSTFPEIEAVTAWAYEDAVKRIDAKKKRTNGLVRNAVYASLRNEPTECFKCTARHLADPHIEMSPR